MTTEDILAIVHRLLAGEVDIDSVMGLPEVTEQDKTTILTLVVWEIERRQPHRRRTAQRRALALLRGLLTVEQQAMLKRTRTFLVTSSLGNTYRLIPETGSTERVVRHGKYLYAEQSYCLHDPENELPPADTTIAHLLLLTADEPAFLALANIHQRNDLLWNGAWLRRLSAARRERRLAIQQTVDAA